jgi:hypothetical protein
VAILKPAVQRQIRSLNLPGLLHLDERKPTGLTRVEILNNCDALYCAVSREKGSQLSSVLAKSGVTYKIAFKTLRP